MRRSIFFVATGILFAISSPSGPAKADQLPIPQAGLETTTAASPKTIYDGAYMSGVYCLKGEPVETFGGTEKLMDFRVEPQNNERFNQAGCWAGSFSQLSLRSGKLVENSLWKLPANPPAGKPVAWPWEHVEHERTVIAALDQTYDIVLWVTEMDQGTGPLKFDVAYPDSCCHGLDTMHNHQLPNWQLFTAQGIALAGNTKDIGPDLDSVAVAPRGVKGWACIYPAGAAPEKPKLDDCMRGDVRKM
jgi:hypothetical protein